MILDSPITIIPPNITKQDGSTKTFDPIILDKLDITLVDNSIRKIVYAQIKPCPRPLILWEKQDYDNIGDYTQTQAEDRIKQLLGDNPKNILENLFFPIR